MIFAQNLGTEQAKYAAKDMELVCPTMKINNPGSFDLINKGKRNGSDTKAIEYGPFVAINCCDNININN